MKSQNMLHVIKHALCFSFMFLCAKRLQFNVINRSEKHSDKCMCENMFTLKHQCYDFFHQIFVRSFSIFYLQSAMTDVEVEDNSNMNFASQAFNVSHFCLCDAEFGLIAPACTIKMYRQFRCISDGREYPQTGP